MFEVCLFPVLGNNFSYRKRNLRDLRVLPTSQSNVLPTASAYKCGVLQLRYVGGGQDIELGLD
jgi:hypothetical protein